MTFRYPRPPENADQPERDRGFLTSRDRELLKMGDEDRDIAEGTWYNARRRIVRRARNALRDFQVVYEHLDEPDREKVFYTPRESVSSSLHLEMYDATPPSTEWLRRIQHPEDLYVGVGAWCALAFIYEGVGEDEFDQMLSRAFAHTLTGTREVGKTSPRMAGIDVSVDITHTNTAVPFEIGRKVENHGTDDLTNAELAALVHIAENTGGQLPSTRDEFIEKCRDYMTEHHPDVDFDKDSIVFSTDPFRVLQEDD